jgi:hypothetical protein
MWFCSGFGYQCFVLALFKYFRNFAVGVIEVAKIHALGWANGNASRLLAFFYAVHTKRTFINISIRVRIPRIVWAACNTCAAADAFIVGNQHNSTIFIMAGSGWAASYTGRIFAMVATLRAYFDFQLRVGPVGYFHNPVAAVTNWHVIFGLTGYYTI